MRQRTPQWIAAAFGLLLALPAQAAQVYFGAPGPSFGVGAAVDVGVFLGSDGESVNAVEGTIRFPKDLLRLTDVRPAGSVVSFWVEQPRLGESGDIRFAGIVPGGFQGDRGPLFSLTFEALKAGKAEVDASQVSILRNDGAGTPASVRPAPMVLDIVANGPQPPFLLPKDAEAPDAFTPTLASDPNLFDGAWFAAFAAEDKQSGVATYEVKEGPPADSIRAFFDRAPWRFVESPYKLEHQDGTTRVLIRATDRAGNVRVAEVPARLPTPWYERMLLWGILGGITVLSGAIVLWRNLRGRR